MAVLDHSRPDGEPFVLLEGISIWPATLARVIAAICGILFLGKGKRDLHRQITATLEATAAPVEKSTTDSGTWGSKLPSSPRARPRSCCR